MNKHLISLTSEYQYDKNCCTVVTLSVIADMPFPEAQKILAKAGRKKKCGMYIGDWLPVYENYVSMVRKPELDMYVGKQVRTFMADAHDWIQKSTIVIRTNRHVFAIQNGKIEDWMTKDRRHTIIDIWLVQPKVSKFKNQSGSEYTIEKRKQGGWLLTRTATGKTEVITQAMHDKTLKRLYDGEVIPFRNISYTVAIEQAVLFLLIDHVHIDPFKRVYSVRKPRKVIKLKR